MAYHPGMQQKYNLFNNAKIFFFLTVSLLNLNLLLLLRCIKTHTRSNTLYMLGENLIWNNYTGGSNPSSPPLPPTCSVTLRMSP